MVRGEWQTEENIRFLRENYSDVSVDVYALATQWGISFSALIGKANRMGLTRETIKKYKTKDVSRKPIAKEPVAVAEKPTVSWRTPENLEYVRANANNPEMSVKDIAAHCNASESAVHKWMRRNGLNKCQKLPDWMTERNLAYVREYYSNLNIKVDDIARRCGTTNASITFWARRQGLERLGSFTGIKAPYKPKTVVRATPAVEPLEIKPVVSAPVVRGPATVFRKIVSRAKDSCCWIDGDGRPWIYCDAPAMPYKSYCEEHAKKAYQPRKVRELESAY